MALTPPQQGGDGRLQGDRAGGSSSGTRGRASAVLTVGQWLLEPEVIILMLYINVLLV
jgi:hypothetical protein